MIFPASKYRCHPLVANLLWQDAQSELNNLQKLMDQHDEQLSTLREESAQYQEDLAGSRCFTVCVFVNPALNQQSCMKRVLLPCPFVTVDPARLHKT